MRLTSFLLGFLFCLPGAYASVITGSGHAKTVEGVPASLEAKASVDSRSYSLKLVGAGLRYKKIAFIKPNVYVGELFVDAPEKVQKTGDGVLASLEAQKAVAIRMTFLRDVDGEKVSNGFKEALEENKVNLDGASIKAFLNAVKAGGEAKDKKTIIVLTEKLGGGKEAVTYENAAGKAITIQGGPGLVHDILSIWFGRINDSGLESLKKEILGLQD